MRISDWSSDVCSSDLLLIGNDHTSAKARAAALHALLVTVAGGLVMLGGFVVLAQSAGSYRLTAILDAAPSGPGVSVALVLVLIGVTTKSAPYPFHGWLPEIGRASCRERVFQYA